MIVFLASGAQHKKCVWLVVDHKDVPVRLGALGKLSLHHDSL